VPRIALDLAILPVLPGFRRAYPDVSVEIDVNDQSVDLPLKGFDAGIRIGHFIERDMIAVRLTPKPDDQARGTGPAACLSLL
jgi:DNA-binding transcriptional LysR family regulator